METLRTFVALDIRPNDELIANWNELKNILKFDRIKWVDSNTLHLTLFFLGDTPANKIKTMSQNITQALFQTNSFPLTIKGFGSFGKPNQPKVLWVGVESSRELLELKEKINGALIPLGFLEEHKEFNPHITLGRVKEIKPTEEIKKFIQQKKEVMYQTVNINEVVLYQSILRSDGPIYKPLNTFKLHR